MLFQNSSKTMSGFTSMQDTRVGLAGPLTLAQQPSFSQRFFKVQVQEQYVLFLSLAHVKRYLIL